MNNVIGELSVILAARKGAAPDTSYVASLHAKGLNKILEKVGEEATEAIIAAKDAEQTGKTDDVVYEIADLWFHTLVALSHLEVEPEAVLTELARRFGLSGLEEKANRDK